MTTPADVATRDHHAYPTGDNTYACPCGAGGRLFLGDLTMHLVEVGMAHQPADVASLREQLAAAEDRIQTEIDWQHQIAARAAQEAAQRAERSIEALRKLLADMDRWQRIGREVEQLGLAGRKTVRLADLTGKATP